MKSSSVTSAFQGTVAIVTIAAVAYADSWLYANRRMETLIEGKPTIVVRDGEFDRTGMRRERMNETDVLGHLRAQGIHRPARGASRDRRARWLGEYPQAAVGGAGPEGRRPPRGAEAQGRSAR